MNDRVPMTICPSCGMGNDAATCVVSDQGGPDRSIRPQAGDVTICLYCATWMVFEADLSARLPTEIEARVIEDNPRCGQVEAVVLEMWRERT